MEALLAAATVPTLAMGRAVVSKHVLAREPAEAAEIFETVFRAAAAGEAQARRASLICGSAIVHARAGGPPRDAAALDAIRDAASAASLDLTARILADAPAHKRLLPRGRLFEIGIGADRLFAPDRPDWGHDWRYTALFSELEKMRRHHDPRFVRRLLAQRWIRRRDVLFIASRRPSVPAIADAVALDDRWFAMPEVREALVQNPFASTSLALALLPITRGPILRHLRDAGDAHPLVAGAAGSLLDASLRGPSPRTSAP